MPADIDYHKLSDEFWQQGWTILPPVDKKFAQKLQRRALVRMSIVGHRRDGISSGGSPSKYDVIDGVDVAQQFTELVGLYHGIRPLVEFVTGRPMILSPWTRSAINIKLYKGLGATQGWHKDSNPVSVLVYLTNFGSALEVRDSNGKKTRFYPEIGKVAILRGKDCEHRVVPSREPDPRICVVMNMYHPDDCDRPAWLDGVIYENKPVPNE